MKTILSIFLPIIFFSCYKHNSSKNYKPINEVVTVTAVYDGEATTFNVIYKPSLNNKSNFKGKESIFATTLFYTEDSIVYLRKKMTRMEEDTSAFQVEFKMGMKAFYASHSFYCGETFIDEMSFPSLVYDKDTNVLEGGLSKFISICPDLECAKNYFTEDSIRFPKSYKRYYSLWHGMLKSGIDTLNIFPDLRIILEKTIAETDENKIQIFLISAALYADAEKWDKCLSNLKKVNDKSKSNVKLKWFNEELIGSLSNSIIKCPKNIAKDIINELYEIVDKGSSINGLRALMFINTSPNNEEGIKLVNDELMNRCANRTLPLLKAEKSISIFSCVPDIYYSLIEEFNRSKDYNKTFEVIDIGVQKLSIIPRWEGKFVTFMSLEGTIATLEVERGKAFIAIGDTNQGIRYLRDLVYLNQKNMLPSFRYASRFLSTIYSKRGQADSVNYYLKIADSEQNKSDKKDVGEYEIKLCVASWCSICRLHTLSSEHLLREKLKGKAKITVVADDKMIDELKKQDPTISFENGTPALLTELGVQGMPTMVVLRGKNVVTRFSSIDDSTSIKIAKSIMETLK